jgi:hypothetical protein
MTGVVVRVRVVGYDVGYSYLVGDEVGYIVVGRTDGYGVVGWKVGAKVLKHSCVDSE